MRPHFAVQLRNEIWVLREKIKRQTDKVVYLFGGINNRDHKTGPGALQAFRLPARPSGFI
jgi:hypothetical protein